MKEFEEYVEQENDGEPENFDILNWWKTNGRKTNGNTYPILQQILK